MSLLLVEILPSEAIPCITCIHVLLYVLYVCICIIFVVQGQTTNIYTTNIQIILAKANLENYLQCSVWCRY